MPRCAKGAQREAKPQSSPSRSPRLDRGAHHPTLLHDRGQLCEQYRNSHWLLCDFIGLNNEESHPEPGQQIPGELNPILPQEFKHKDQPQ